LRELDDNGGFVPRAPTRADLRGIDVEVRYINRPKWRHIQTTSHVAFWRRVFKRFGTEVSFDGAPTLPSAACSIPHTASPDRDTLG
jgi:hypothetical protein